MVELIGSIALLLIGSITIIVLQYMQRDTTSQIDRILDDMHRRRDLWTWTERHPVKKTDLKT